MKKPNIVLDTNVLVSAFRSRRGASSRLLGLIERDIFQLHISVPIFFEYEAKLRERTNLSEQAITSVLAFIYKKSERHIIYFRLRPSLPDAGDEMLLELAVKSRCDAVISYNKKHLKPLAEYGIQVFDAREFLDHLGVLP